MTEDRLEGLVVKAQSGFFTVATDNGRVVCKLRGRLLQEQLGTDPCAVGDRVLLTVLDDGSGIIEEVFERERTLSRNAIAPGGRGSDMIDREQVILANLDQAVFVLACAEPEANPRFIDRLLVAAEKSDVPALIVANKLDLVSRKEARNKFDLYDALGYPVFYTSALKGTGVNKLRKQLEGRISALSGPSGVGKSSLLNAIQPKLGLRVGEVSEATTKGRHITVTPELFALDGGGYVADTPGIRSIALWDIEPDELDGYYVEIAHFAPQCRFNNCRHINEPGCAVIAAVEAGDVYHERYESFLRLREEIEDLYI